MRFIESLEYKKTPSRLWMDLGFISQIVKPKLRYKYNGFKRYFIS